MRLALRPIRAAEEGLPEILKASGVTKAHVVETGKGFCALATKPVTEHEVAPTLVPPGDAG